MNLGGNKRQEEPPAPVHHIKRGEETKDLSALSSRKRLKIAAGRGIKVVDRDRHAIRATAPPTARAFSG